MTTPLWHVLPAWPLLDWICVLWLLLCALVLLSPLCKLTSEAGSYGKLHQLGTRGGSGAKSESPRQLEKLLLHPALYVKTSTAFTAYYALASAWNAWLLYETMVREAMRMQRSCCVCCTATTADASWV